MGFSKNPLRDPQNRHLGCWRQNVKTRFSEKLSNLVSCNWAFQRSDYWIPKIQDGWDAPSWKSTWRHFLCRVWSDLDKMSDTGAEWHVECGDVVEIETRCRIPIWRTFGRIQWHMSSQSHLPHYRVLPPSEFNVMIPELRATLQGAAAGRIQWHVILEPKGAASW